MAANPLLQSFSDADVVVVRGLAHDDVDVHPGHWDHEGRSTLISPATSVARVRSVPQHAEHAWVQAGEACAESSSDTQSLRQAVIQGKKLGVIRRTARRIPEARSASLNRGPLAPSGWC